MPYIYKVTFNQTNQYYVGSQYNKASDPSDLGTRYFTSSPAVQCMLFEHGKKNVTFEILSVLDSVQETRSEEARLIYECIDDELCLNKKRGFNLVEGRVWITDGINEKRVYPDEIPEGYKVGRADSMIETMRVSGKKTYRLGQEKVATEAVRGSIWINDGVTNKRIKETDAIPQGYSKGRMYKRK